MSIVFIHSRLAYTAVFFSIAMALWGIWRYIRKQGIDSSYWGALYICGGLVLVQVVLGTIIWLSGAGHLGEQTIHILYGAVAVLVIPGVFIYTRGEERRRNAAIYGLAFIFLAGILIRAIMTAP